MKKVNYAPRDQNGKAVLYILLRKRKDMALTKFYSYWKNVHGLLSAQLPGQYQYWQFHLANNSANLWPVTNGIISTISEEDQLDGIAELTFLSEEYRQCWLSAASVIASDEQNFVSKAIIYFTNNYNSQTYIDGIETDEPNGDLDVVKFHVMVKKANAISVDDFRKYMVNEFAPDIVKNDLVLKFRLHLLEEHDNSLPSTPGVSGYEPLEKQYQAAFEIAFKERTDLEKFFASETYTAVVKHQTKYIKQIAAFLEQQAYTFVYNGKTTLAVKDGMGLVGTI